jgi:hypothetical protein
MTDPHIMQVHIAGRPAPVSALSPAGERKEVTINRATPGIVLGFAREP